MSNKALARNPKSGFLLIALWWVSAVLPTILKVSISSAWTVFLSTVSATVMGGFLVWLVKNDIKHQQSERRDDKRAGFDFAVQSHMAARVFDGYVAFCEEFIAKMDEAIIGSMNSDHSDPNKKKALDFIRELAEIRRRHALWVPEQLNPMLDKLGLELSQQGILDEKLSNRSLPAQVDDMTKIFEEYQARLDRFVGITPDDRLKDTDFTRARLLRKLREELGVGRLGDMLTFYASKSSEMANLRQ